MFDLDSTRQSPFRTPEPPQSEFTIKLTPERAAVIQKLASRGGVAPQEIMERLLLRHPFDITCDADVPGQVKTWSINYWLDFTLRHIGLIDDDALDRSRAALLQNK